MTAWNPADFKRMAAADEITVRTRRADGTLRSPVTIWVVREGDDLYVRSYKGPTAGWYRGTQADPVGRVQAGDVEAEVQFSREDEEALNARIDAAYSEKYAQYGPSYIRAMTAPEVRATTLKLTPIQR